MMKTYVVGVDTDALRAESPTFLSPEQIVDELKKRISDAPSQRAFAANFTPHPDAQQTEGFAVRYARSMSMMHIRNRYGLWDRRNPFVQFDFPDLKDGEVITDLRHPDNMSGWIYDRLVEHFKTLHPDTEYCDRLPGAKFD